MVRDDVQVHGPDGVRGAYQLKFLVDRQVAEMQPTKLPESEVDADRLSILTAIFGLRFERATVRVRAAAAGHGPGPGPIQNYE